MWPTITTRTLARTNRTVVVVASISFEVPDSLAPVFPAYEERFLFFVLSLLQQPGSIVIYVTSQPILPRIVDYYFQLVPELNTPDVRQRLFLVSPVDASPRPLTEKIITRPRVIERIARMIPDPRRALIYPFNTSPLEGELGRRLDVPVYGPNPSLAHLGTKSGSRRLFAEEGGAPSVRGRGGNESGRTRRCHRAHAQRAARRPRGGRQAEQGGQRAG